MENLGSDGAKPRTLPELPDIFKKFLVMAELHYYDVAAQRLAPIVDTLESAGAEIEKLIGQLEDSGIPSEKIRDIRSRIVAAKNNYQGGVKSRHYALIRNKNSLIHYENVPIGFDNPVESLIGYILKIPRYAVAEEPVQPEDGLPESRQSQSTTQIGTQLLEEGTVKKGHMERTGTRSSEATGLDTGHNADELPTRARAKYGESLAKAFNYAIGEHKRHIDVDIVVASGAVADRNRAWVSIYGWKGKGYISNGEVTPEGEAKADKYNSRLRETVANPQ